MQSLSRRSEPIFWLLLVASVMVHLAAVSGLGSLLPKTMQFLPIPSLNIKLGSDDLEADASARPVPLLPPPQVGKEVPLTERAVKQLDKLLEPSTPKQAVRERKIPEAVKQTGSTLGNTPLSKQERLTAYTQTLSLWLQKFKVYTEEARAKGLSGSAVVRIRIDREGNVLFVSFRQRTGHDELDQAVLEMIDRANPLPPVPKDYPVDDPFLEFLIPISFTLAG